MAPVPRPARHRTPGGGTARPGRILVLGTVALNLLAAAAAAAYLSAARSQVIEVAEGKGRVLARLVAQGVGGALDRIDLALQVVGDEVARLPGGRAARERVDPGLAAALERLRARTPDLEALEVLDPDGAVVAAAPAAGATPSPAGTGFVAALRAGAPSAVSRPMPGPAPGSISMAFARRLTGADGAFAGAAVGLVDLRHLFELVSTPDVGPGGVVTVRDEALELVIRSGPGGASTALRPAPPTQLLRAFQASGDVETTYQASPPADGILRSVNVRRVAGHPFLVMVGQSHAALLAPWRRQATLAAGLLVAFAALTGAGTWLARRAQLELAESEARLAATFEALPDALNITHLTSGRIVLVNQGFTRVTGWPAAEAMGRTTLELGLWVDLAARAAALQAVAARGAVDDLDATFRRRDGALFTGQVSARTVELGGEGHLLTITHDVTRQRRLEARMQQAERLESIGRLAGGVAHDFNNMLAVILGEAALLASDLPPGHPGQEGLREITLAGERSRDLTRQLLAFSRRQPVYPRVVDLAGLVAQARPTLARLIGEDVALSFEPGEALRPVRLDPGQFVQVLVNLAANARDAMPGGGHLALATRNVTLEGGPGGLPPGEYVRLTVRDDGAGMPPEVLAHLFEPFFTTKGPGRGTGLGLATAHGIVEQAGGAIRVESAPGRGTTFTIDLPAAEGSPAVPAEEAAAAPPRGMGTILLVEDEALVRRTTRRMLEALGYRVLEAAGAEEALRQAAAAPFDLLLSDVMMPDVKGPELAGRLAETRPGLRALFISGYSAGSLGEAGTGAGAYRLLHKPFGLEALAQAVRDALAPGGAPADAG